MLFFFFKQKTAYEMRISDWSSDVCSSDLVGRERVRLGIACARGDELVIAVRRHWKMHIASEDAGLAKAGDEARHVKFPKLERSMHLSPSVELAWNEPKRIYATSLSRLPRIVHRSNV